MREASQITAKLQGGPLDGDVLGLIPLGSSTPPKQLSYLSAQGEEAVWLVYEVELDELTCDWPFSERSLDYHYIGSYSLGRDRLLRAGRAAQT